MIIQYQDPRLFDLFQGDKLFMLQDSEVHVVSEIRHGLKQVRFEDGFQVDAALDDILTGCVLIRKVDIDI